MPTLKEELEKKDVKNKVKKAKPNKVTDDDPRHPEGYMDQLDTSADPFLAYNNAKSYLNKLATETLKKKSEFLQYLEYAAKDLAQVADDLAEAGSSKEATGVTIIRNKVLGLRKKIDAGVVTDVNTVKETCQQLHTNLCQFSPYNIGSMPNKAGIKNQSKTFEGFNNARVELAFEGEAYFELKQAPVLLLFKTKVTPLQKSVLKKLKAHFYQGTNGVSIPGVPIIVLDKRQVSEADYDRAIKTVFKAMKVENQLTYFRNLAVSKGDFIAFPVSTIDDAEVMHLIYFEATKARELWVK